MDEGNKFAGVKGGGGGVMGADGIGATVAEPLPLIAALDKETYQIGNQSFGLRGFEIFLWTMDRPTLFICSPIFERADGILTALRRMIRRRWRFRITRHKRAAT